MIFLRSMLNATRQSLEDFIVRTLSTRRDCSAAQVRSHIRHRFGDFSVAAIYKELRKLQQQGVIIKTGTQFSLSLPWILNLIELTDQMYDLHVESAQAADILPVSVPRKSFVFPNLARGDDFWVHAIILMLRHSSRKTLFQWLPHPWFHLINGHKSFPFHNALRAAGFRINSIVGGESFLDQYSKRLTTKGVYEFSYAPGPFRELRKLYYSVTDRYLLTLRLTEPKAVEIDSFYNSVKSWKGIDATKLVDLMGQRTKTVITIESAKPKVKHVWNKFVDYFDVSEKLKLT